MSYLKRKLEPHVKNYMKIFPVISITGPRQSGKSTLLRELLPEYTYLTFDDQTKVLEFEDDPKGFMNRYHNHVIFDEAQYVPKIFNYVKLAVDEDRQNYGKFVLSGSAQFNIMQNITESLAGRIGLLTLLPMQYSEIPDSIVKESILKGGYPELVARNYNYYKEWYESYFSTYINRDVRIFSNIGDLRDFQRFVRLLAGNTAQQLNMSNYAKDIGVSVPTIKRWLSVLEASYIIFLLPPYYKNLGKRIVKTPKVYFYDTGLVCHLVGIQTQEHYEHGPMTGSIFENYIISEILKKEHHSQSGAELYYSRIDGGMEIDLIIEKSGQQQFVEIKNSATFFPKMLKTIHEFVEKTKSKALLIYRGESRRYTEKIDLVNYSDYLSK